MLYLGVYGCIVKEGRILVIRKSRGPYRGLFDLPGGSPAHGEVLDDALKREIQEETGVTIESWHSIKNDSFLIPYENKPFYHVALIYQIDGADFSKHDQKIREEDAEGNLWLEIPSIGEKHCSLPLKSALIHMQNK